MTAITPATMMHLANGATPPVAAPPLTGISKKLLAAVIAVTFLLSMAGAVALSATVFSHTGPTGAHGLVGATGAAGAQGVQGVQGPRGRVGKVGLAGAAGASGANGTDGTDGVNSVSQCSNDLTNDLPYC